jgi:aromatic ring-opening dioxygenase catalytic subunit (LigB family)
MTTPRQPTLFIPHGGGPCFWIESPPPFGPHAWDRLRDYLAGLVASLPAPPKAFLVVTAHWETDQPTVSTAAAPGMIYDYFGFPAHTYELKYPAPGAPELGRKAESLIAAAGLPVVEDGERGFDHGVFVPFLIMDPEARIPVMMLSLRRDLDPTLHIRVGEALAPLRDEGVAIIGSGMSYHDLRHFRDGDGRDSEIFDAWLGEAMTTPDAAAREQSLIHWAEAPAGRACHPREEHLLPLMVVAGAAGTSRGVRDFHDVIGGKTISAFRFG